jgi:hypothetical protein
MEPRSACGVSFVRDEEAAGSNPATPTRKPQVKWYPVTCGSHSASPGVRFWEPNGSGAVATRYDKLSVRYEATVHIAAINEWLLPGSLNTP